MNKLIYIILSMLIISSCKTNHSPQNKSSETIQKSNLNSSALNSEQNNINWFVSNTEFQGILNIPFNFSSSIYLKGNPINTYITNNNLSNVQFCMVIHFNTSNSSIKKHLRLRVIPENIFKTNNKTFKIKTFPSKDNKSICSGNEFLYDKSGNKQVSIPTDEAAYSLNEVCPSCTSPIISSFITLYQTPISDATKVSNNHINLTSLKVQINNSEADLNEGNNCSDQTCQQKGYSCCLQGQCVTDRALRPASTIDINKLSEALIDIKKDPDNFKKYPTIYFVCPLEINENENEESNTTSPTDEAKIRLNQDIKDYNCLEGVAAECDPDLITVKKKIWRKCGCLLDPITDNPLDPRCPDYGLEPVMDNENNIIQMICYNPPQNKRNRTFQGLNISLSAKTSPHRFFSTSGINYDDLSTVPIGTVQEGEKFSYLNSSTKSAPIETSFSMNSILGQMNINLTEALPAKVINIEFEQTYIISASNGFYTPCLSCQKDPWFLSFSAYPETTSPHGITWSGYTTNRSTYSNNITHANYEDLIFGRACWVPPTMLPYSHLKSKDINTQRRNRLATQSAFYVNGLQRDWYGFNKGALIGSFNGHTWFAIGNGRKVHSTTNKLFLAINAPFADLAENTNYSVSIIQDIAVQSAATYDYHFELKPDSSGQNPGASCQYMHQCNSDSDCISKLGWEYTCSNIEKLATNLPKFDLHANEIADFEYTTSTFKQALFSGLNGDSTKRCVYRGNGSLCKINYLTELGDDKDVQELLRCAPGFYCAKLNSSNFNKEVIRSPNNPSVVSYGQIANILGRPKIYATASYPLPIEVQKNILENAKRYTSNATLETFGLCIAGRNISQSDPVNQHQNRDVSSRSDHINQLGICDSSISDLNKKTQGCPLLNSDGNYQLDGDLNDLKIQNFCGGQSLNLDASNTFNTIENEKNIASIYLTGIQTPSILRNSCYRRSSNVCHTDLNCSPNKLHSEAALNLSEENFGGTKAELDFWKEELICGQKKSKPIFSISTSDEYYNYDLGQNVCCREISREFTMYTSYDQTNPSNSILSGYDDENIGLIATTSSQLPSQSGRYSRYSISNSGVDVNVDSRSIPTFSQWKTINETGGKTCCGGGFIRKFSDGTNDWSDKNRLNFSPESFACINYPEVSYFAAPEGINTNNWMFYYDKLCLFPAYNNQVESINHLIGCIQYDIHSKLEESLSSDDYPTPLTSVTTKRSKGIKYLSTNPGSDFTGTGTINSFLAVTNGVPYPPTSFKDLTYTNNLLIIRDPANFNDLLNPNDNTIALIIPHYIRKSNITSIDIILKGSSEQTISFNPNSSATSQASGSYTIEIYTCSNTDITTFSSTSNNVRFCYDNINGRDIIKIFTASDGFSGWEYGYIQINFSDNYPVGALLPGSDQYYEDAFSRLELLGIPQVTQKPIVCNNSDSTNYTLIPSIYGSDYDSIDDFSDGIYFDENGAGGDNLLRLQNSRIHYTSNFSTINIPAVFSPNQFKCCSKLGSSVFEKSLCCSDYALADASNPNTFICKLKSGTNLNLYLNQFISSESNTIDNELSFQDDDFDPETGYPKYKQSVYTKIREFAKRHCENQDYIQGGAFGSFIVQPNNGFFQSEGYNAYHSIVDSLYDYDQNTLSGYKAFFEGYRWNIHQYCN